MKEKGQQHLVGKLELLAHYRARSLRVEQPIVTRPYASSTLVAPATLTQPANSANRWQDSDSHSRSHTSPSNSSIRLLAVELNRRFRSDLPQLPDRMPEIRKA